VDADRQIQEPLDEHAELYNQMMLNPTKKQATVKALRRHPKTKSDLAAGDPEMPIKTWGKEYPGSI